MAAVLAGHVTEECQSAILYATTHGQSHGDTQHRHTGAQTDQLCDIGARAHAAEEQQVDIFLAVPLAQKSNSVAQ